MTIGGAGNDNRRVGGRGILKSELRIDFGVIWIFKFKKGDLFPKKERGWVVLF
jgi:hypothetical protein